MKKLFLVLALFAVFAFNSFAQEKSTESEPKEGWTTFSYTNVPVLKILYAREGYVVIYQKHGIGIGSTVIPKDWVHQTSETKRKLRIRTVTGSTKSYMTIVKDKGEFQYVILNMPRSRGDSVYGVVADGTVLDTDKTDLSDVVL